MNYQENSQGAQGSIGSSGSGMHKQPASGSGSDFVLPSVPNKMAMGGMKGLPGMPASKGLESRGQKSNNGKQGSKFAPYKSNLGAGYNKPGAPTQLNANAFNIPKYG